MWELVMSKRLTHDHCLDAHLMTLFDATNVNRDMVKQEEDIRKSI